MNACFTLNVFQTTDFYSIVTSVKGCDMSNLLISEHYNTLAKIMRKFQTKVEFIWNFRILKSLVYTLHNANIMKKFLVLFTLLSNNVNCETLYNLK